MWSEEGQWEICIERWGIVLMFISIHSLLIFWDGGSNSTGNY